jgi:hypothetical protein
LIVGEPDLAPPDHQPPDIDEPVSGDPKDPGREWHPSGIISRNGLEDP